MSSIDYSKLRSLTAQKLIRALERDDFIAERADRAARGSARTTSQR